MKVMIALLLSTLCFEVLNAQCPEANALKDADGVKLCARMFEDSHYYYEQSCGGEYLDAYPGEDVPIIPWRWNNRISSLVVSREEANLNSVLESNIASKKRCKVFSAIGKTTSLHTTVCARGQHHHVHQTLLPISQNCYAQLA
uniref:Secreted protein n=1 Tax=Oncorhynchus tshawytscha TaxID=74940 RepID=A0AAZ3PWA6_ONCTS